ncbi:MAG: hypothetical protein ACYC5Y_15230 [Symbiobacteriia bacterium]
MSDRTEVLLEEVRDMFRTLADGVVGNTEAIEGLRMEVGELKERQDRIEVRLTAVEHRLTAVETRLTDVETRLTAVEHRLTDVETRLTAVEHRLTSLEGEVGELRRDTGRRLKALEVN